MMMSYGELLAELEQAASASPDSAGRLALHLDLLRAQARAAVPALSLDMPMDLARARQDSGESLLAAERLPLDGGAVRALLHDVLRITTEHRPDVVPLLSGRIVRTTPQGLARQALSYLGQPRSTPRNAPTSMLRRYVLNNTLHPLLRGAAQSLRPYHHEELWQRGYCPICGGWPDFASLDEDKGARRLLCSRCDSEWGFLRLGCPFCDAEDRAIYYPSEDEMYRLYVCDSCRRYLKTIDLRKTADRRPMIVHRYLTLNMDTAAVSAGYRGV